MIITMLKKRLQRRSGTARVITVLGMHRSGTSLMTGSLQQAGLELHRYHSFNHHNRKGNRENPIIVDLHNDLLATNGGSWDAPPATVTWREEHRLRAGKLIEACSGYRVWGFKDPRTLLTLDGWLSLIPGLELVGIFRHPAAVASSLQARDTQLTPDRGLRLWGHYNGLLLARHRVAPFPLLCFDGPVDELKSDLTRMAHRLELPTPDKIDFYDRQLVNQDPSQRVDVPPDLLRLYDELRARSGCGS